jgi:hypothetical protein
MAVTGDLCGSELSSRLRVILQGSGKQRRNLAVWRSDFCTQVRFRRYAGEEERSSSRCARLIGLLETPDPPIAPLPITRMREDCCVTKSHRKICKARPLGSASTKQMFAPPFFCECHAGSHERARRKLMAKHRRTGAPGLHCYCPSRHASSRSARSDSRSGAI